jgi:DNA-directed RNA polymerase subunit H (RpoH/RPB5)
MTFDINKHELVSEHKKLSDSEKNKLFETFNIKGKELPKISLTDPALANLGVKQGDIIKIERVSKTAGVTDYYRHVTE